MCDVLPVKRMAKGPWLWVGIVVVAVFLVLQYVVPRSGGDQISTSDLLKALNSNQLSKITFTDGDQQITATYVDGQRPGGGNLNVQTNWIDGDQEYLMRLATQKSNTNLQGHIYSKVAKPSMWGSILQFILPIAFVMLVFWFLMNQAQGGGRG